MAFENLSDRLNQSFKKLVGQDKLTEKNMKNMIHEVRMALIEADTHPDVVDSFIDSIYDKAVGQNVLNSLKPSEMVVKIVNEELIALLGEKEVTLNLESSPTIVMMVGLQGSGKTTSSAKIANYLKTRNNKKVLLVACDLARLAAIEQLQILGNSIGVEVFSKENSSPVEVAKLGCQYGASNGFDVIILDTAGRLHIDQELMGQLSEISRVCIPSEILLTVDAMIGQDIVNVASGFKDHVNLTGLVVTKYDGSSRGGGILSVRHITNVPVKFVGTGEKIDELEMFYPDRVASRILGMGDILTLIEQAQMKIDQKKAEESANRFMAGTFTMDDLLTSLEQINKMGPLSGIMKLLPGGNQFRDQINDQESANQLKKTRAIIQSMTKAERNNPSLIRASQKNRIARGSGVSPSDVNKLLNQYEKMKDSMRIMSRMFKK